MSPTGKSHRLTLVAVPPRALWGPIQAVRRRHDRQIRRWPPHVNLLYPFHDEVGLAPCLARLRAALAAVSPFVARLGAVGVFRHRHGRRTVWLAPEPAAAWQALHAAARSACPVLDDLDRFPGGFTPHLSVGQADARSEGDLRTEATALEGLGWWLDRVAVWVRGIPPDDRFRLRALIPLGAASLRATGPGSVPPAGGVPGRGG